MNLIDLDTAFRLAILARRHDARDVLRQALELVGDPDSDALLASRSETAILLHLVESWPTDASKPLLTAFREILDRTEPLESPEPGHTIIKEEVDTKAGYDEFLQPLDAETIAAINDATSRREHHCIWSEHVPCGSFAVREGGYTVYFQNPALADVDPGVVCLDPKWPEEKKEQLLDEAHERSERERYARLAENPLPNEVKCIIDRPVEQPWAFKAQTGGAEFWDISALLQAYRDAYYHIYAHPTRYGTWDSQIEFVSIESMIYYPGLHIIMIGATTMAKPDTPKGGQGK